MKKLKRILSLDLGSTTLKLVLVESKDADFKLLEARLLEVAPSADPPARQVAFKQLLQGIPRDKGTQIVSVVDDSLLSLRPVVVPPMPESEYSHAVRWELQPNLTLTPDQMRIDCERLSEVESAGTKKLKLLAVAVPKATIQEHLRFLSEAGIEPSQIFPKAMAIAAWAGVSRKGTSDPVGVLDFEAKSSEFLVVQQGKAIFARKIPVGSRDLTSGMTTVLMTSQGQVSLTETEAEAVKRSLGIPRPDSAEVVSKGISGAQVMAMIRSNLERLGLEIERSLVFYGETTAGPTMNELLLVGGGAHLKGLPEFLQERLNLRVVTPEALTGIPHDLAEPLTAGTASMSLSLVPALGAALNLGEGVNLLPTEIKEALKIQMRRAALTGILTAVLLGALLIRIGMGIAHETLRKQIAALEVERQALAPQWEQAGAALAAHEERLREPNWRELFRGLSLQLPREVYLMTLQVEEGEVHLTGRISDFGRPADRVLSEYLKLLNGIFHQVKLVSSRQPQEGQTESEFEIRCRLR